MVAHPRSAPNGNDTPSIPTPARINARLWSARQIESRSAATSTCKAGRVRISGETAKPAQHVSTGDEIRCQAGGFGRLLTVT